MPDDATVDPRALRDLKSLLTAIDQRMSETFERGTKERLYFARTQVPRIVAGNGQPPRRVFRERFMPITAATQPELVEMIRTDLALNPRPTAPPPGADTSRRTLHDSIE